MHDGDDEDGDDGDLELLNWARANGCPWDGAIEEQYARRRR